MTAYQKFKKLNIDHSVIGMNQHNAGIRYFCTPKGAKVIGSAGVDGIHYCFIKGFEEMVFAVSPEGLPGEYVHPIAKSFEDLLRLLLACGTMDVIEQTYMWDEELFDQYVMDNRPNENQLAIMEIIKEAFQITPMEEPYAYIKALQASFDYSKLVFPQIYYQNMKIWEEAELQVLEAKAPEWKVTYEGGFYPRSGRAGNEIRVDKEFVWGNEIWHIPAVYLCTKGLVVDFCVEEEHPLNMEFRTEICVNEDKIHQRQGCAVYWIPKECLLDDMETELEAKWILEHYGYDLQKAWAIHRISYPWTEKRPRQIKTLEVKLEREMAKIPSAPFRAPEAGANHIIVNPVTGATHTFTVREYEEREMDISRFPDDSMEWPTNYAIMTYTLFPELEDFYLQDASQGDSPRRKQTNPHGPMTSSVGIIGLRSKAEDGEEYYHPDGTLAKLRVCCSSMYFEKPEKIEWKMTFREKRVPDIEIQVM